MSFNQIKKKTKFTQISNICILDENLNLEAKGLMCLLCSFPNEWTFYNSFIAKKCGISTDKLNKLYKMLEIEGYIKRDKKRDEKGKFAGFEFEICDEKSLKTAIKEKTTTAKTPLRVNPLTGEAGAEKIATINTNINNNTNSNNNTKKRFENILQSEEIFEGEIL